MAGMPLGNLKTWKLEDQERCFLGSLIDGGVAGIQIVVAAARDPDATILTHLSRVRDGGR